jgi:hypothetical protein
LASAKRASLLTAASNGPVFAKNREAQAIGWQMTTERTTHSSVTFLHAFVLRDLDGMQPPGTYLIETVEEPLGTLSFLAYRRVSTTITLPAVGTASLRTGRHHRCGRVAGGLGQGRRIFGIYDGWRRAKAHVKFEQCIETDKYSDGSIYRKHVVSARWPYARTRLQPGSSL